MDLAAECVGVGLGRHAVDRVGELELGAADGFLGPLVEQALGVADELQVRADVGVQRRLPDVGARVVVAVVRVGRVALGSRERRRGDEDEDGCTVLHPLPIALCRHRVVRPFRGSTLCSLTW